VAAAPLGTASDKLIFDRYRDEVCFGNQVSTVVAVDALNCIVTRATKLLLYLKKTYPAQNWGQYLTASNTIRWDKVVVAGHSQGSGHACYIGKKNRVERVVMLSGPNDYSTYFNSPANWLSQPGQTPLTKQFALLHTRDEIVPFEYQVANLKGLGILAANQVPVLADNLTAPYSNARVLSLNTPAASFHSATVGANSVLPAIWQYMLTAQ
jgi:pimeloyl-ACP methyl ester carboxylesterase